MSTIMTKRQAEDKRPEAIDLSHHLSQVARARTQSPLKGLHKYWGKEGIISLAGGLPHPDFFPFDDISARAYGEAVFPESTSSQSPSLLSRVINLFTRKRGERQLNKLKVPRYAAHPGDIDLATVLQYGLSTGLPQLQTFIKEFVEHIYQPAYSNWTVLVHTGNTDGWTKAFLTLCNPGDAILTCEWTYPSAVAAVWPYGITTISVPMDREGMRSDALFEILSTWDENERGKARPRVMYTVPVGQNPAGTTMHAQRKKEIYQICVKFDVIIVEDDPYYFLQEGPYMLPVERPTPGNQTNAEFLASLAPSYLRFDYQGRVIRLDSFSKTIAPGSRLGWFTCNPIFAERLERVGETSTQAPCGFSQGLVTSLLLNWKLDGYVRWLKGLRRQYRERRDFCVDCFADVFRLEARAENAGQVVYDGYIKAGSARLVTNWTEKFGDGNEQFPVFTFVPPTAGMFVWLQVNFKSHPAYKRVGFKSLEDKLWTMFAEAGVLVAPGSIFSANPAEDNDNNDGHGHLRLSFSNADLPALRKAIEIMAVVFKEFFFGDSQLGN